jgi:hypothetical protein
MATIDRIEPAYKPVFKPALPAATGFTDGAAQGYVGRHRRAQLRRFSVLRVFAVSFYAGRHRRH